MKTPEQLVKESQKPQESQQSPGERHIRIAAKIVRKLRQLQQQAKKNDQNN